MDKFANLQALVNVVDSGSFSKAAERLGIAKSVVSRRVSALEEELGVQLLQRTTRSQSLTGPGRIFHQRAVHILADLEEAEQSLIDTSVSLRGSLKLAAPLSFGLHHLSRTLNEFMAEHPAIELDLDLNDREVNLVEEGFDMAVRIGVLRDSNLLARRLGKVRFVTCASPGYLARHGVPRHPRELDKHSGLHYANATPKQVWQFADGKRGTLVSVPGIRMRSNNGDALAAAAVDGLGIISTPTFIVADLLVSGKLVSILDDHPRPGVGIYAVYPPGRLMPRRVQLFADFLASRIGDLPEWDRQLGISA